jgi:hypothetical protein
MSYIQCETSNLHELEARYDESMKTLFSFFIFFSATPGWALSPAPPLYESVLFVGDDHVAGAFGNAVDAYLRTISIDVISIAECGSTPGNWIGAKSGFQRARCGLWQRDEQGQERRTVNFKAKSLAEELAKADPDLTVIALGTYMLKSDRDIQSEQAAVEKMIAEVLKIQSKCVWIGPPKITREPFASNLDDGVRTLKRWLSKSRCEFVDSTQFSIYKGSDGLTYQVAAGTNWGALISRELEKLSRPSPREQQSLNIDQPEINSSSPSQRAPQ